MHRTAARASSFDPLLPSHTSTSSLVDRRKDCEGSLPPSTHIYLEAPIRDGLHTPPDDNMSSLYQPQQYSNPAGRQASVYSMPPMGPIGQEGYSGGYTSNALRQYSTSSQSTRVPSQVPASALRNEVQNPLPSYRQQPPSPLPPNRSNAVSVVTEQPQRKSTSGDMILPNLRISSSINNSGGSLAEFAAQITCLFWFEPTETLNKAEKLSPSSSPVKRLRDEAIPSSGFRKWVVTILSTTQVTQNVILLALLFIYRLKKINPAVKGRSGSEYRLLTVALMLGNKFLDDNTYTNKTWAEVSGISVTEIHVMEVEFLSNMRYSLLASEAQWKDWQAKLGKFWTYCDQASRAPALQISPIRTTLDPSLPSPPNSMQASPPQPTLITNGLGPSSVSSSPYSQGQQWSANHHGVSLSSPLRPVPEHAFTLTRKRSYDSDAEEPAPKRITRPATIAPSHLPQSAPPMRHDAPRLPVPHLTISTSQPMSNGYNSATSVTGPVLPPIGGRAMSSVYPTTPAWTPHLPVLTPTGPPSQHGPPSAGGYTTPSRRHSPHSVQELLSLGSSPISANFPHNTPGHISPSLFLQHRNSPYKPIRHVNTLLYPPPSSSIQGPGANPSQMHYQLLGRRNDHRPGIVPEYVSHPHYQQYPILPQPNFNV